jgi:hypothetical protein
MLHIQLDVFGLTEEHLTRIAAKIDQVPSILNTYWHRV